MDRKRLLYTIATLILSFTILFCQISSVVAVDDGLTSTTQSTDKKENKKEDKKEDSKEDNKEVDEKVRKEGQKPIIPDYETAILIDGISGNVLFEERANQRMYPASTTKIMTSLITLEAIERGEISKDTQIEITEEMLAGADPDGTNIALKVGELISIENLLKGMLIPSGNDAASSIATYIGNGNKATFVDRMNAKAAELGCNDTHFANPDGLHDENHYTTAADMAKIAFNAMKIFEFRNIVDCAHIKIPPTNLSPERYYINTNGLLSTMRYLDYSYSGANGIKTGYTSNAGNCLVSSVKRDGMEFIGVIFGGKSVVDSHKDSIQMFDWAFEAHTSATPVTKGSMICDIKVRQGKGNDSVALSASSNLTVVIPKGTSLDSLEFRPNIPEYIIAPVKTDDKIGTVSILLNGQELASCDLLASANIERSFFWPVMAVGTFLWENTLTRVIIIILAAAAVAFALLFIVGIWKNIKKARKHKDMRKKNHR